MNYYFYFAVILFLAQLLLRGVAESGKETTGFRGQSNGGSVGDYNSSVEPAAAAAAPMNPNVENSSGSCNNPTGIIHGGDFLTKSQPIRRYLICPAEPAPKVNDSLVIPSLFPELLPQSIHFVTRATEANLAKRRLLFSSYRWIDSKSVAVDIVMQATGLQLAPLGLAKHVHCLGFINVGSGKRAPGFLPQTFVLKYSGKYSQMANSTTLDFKVDLIRNFRRFQQKFGNSWGDWHLSAYILPEERYQFLSVFYSDVEREWIYKPSTTANSFGIKLMNLKNMGLDKDEKSGAVIQQHLENPFLLNGAKIEPRFFVLITSLHPLRMYIYDNSYFKVLHNYESVMWGHRYGNQSYPTVYEKKTFAHFWPIMKSAGFSPTKLKKQIYDLIIKAVLMGEAEMFEASKTLPRRSTFQHFSIDFMWDRDNMKPYLIEINRFPWLSHADTWPEARRHLADMLTLVGIKIHSAPTDATTTISNGTECENIMPNFHLSYKDLMSLMAGEDELHRMQYTGYSRIFPTADTANYLPYVESNLKAYKIQHEWEHRFGRDRKEGVRYLRCRLNRSLKKGSKYYFRESNGD